VNNELERMKKEIIAAFEEKDWKKTMNKSQDNRSLIREENQ
jgi:hypothetical protein